MASPTQDPREAAHAAHALGQPWIPLTTGRAPTSPTRMTNPANKPAYAMMAGNLRPVSADVLGMDLQEAYLRIRPAFQEAREAFLAQVSDINRTGVRTKTGRTYDETERGIISLNNLLSPVKGILKANTKLQKVDPRIKEKAMTLGLVLVPEHMAF